MIFNAGVILTDEEVRQLTEAGCEIYPMQWIEVDKNAHPRRDNDYAQESIGWLRKLWVQRRTSGDGERFWPHMFPSMVQKAEDD